MSRITRPLLAIAAALSLAACALAPGNTPEEQGLLDAADQKRIAPRTKAARKQIAEAPALEQAAFWAQEYENNPADLEAATHYAETTRRIGQPARAAAVANQVLTQHPDHLPLLLTLGAALIEDSRGAAAVDPLHRALGLSPGNTAALSRLGVALDHAERHDEARMRYREALQRGGESSAVRANLGLSYLMDGDPMAAEVELRRAMELPGADSRVRQNLALTLALQGEWDEAEALAQQDLSAEAARENISSVRELITRRPRWDSLRAAYDE
ncbi:MAG: hypothetical protein MI723_09710 [Caulobacterales bacterium]|nr:hypothetical protein [Caulobacterales bacterium]